MTLRGSSHHNFMLPPLPSELWIKILRTATEISGLRDNDSNPSGRVVGHQATLETKMAIVGVCRTWRAIGIDFLYEYIVLSVKGGETKTAALCEWFSELFVQHADEPRGYGRATKRIDFEIFLLQNGWADSLFRLLGCIQDLNVLVALPYRAGARICEEDILMRLWHLVEERFSHSLWRLAANLSTHHVKTRNASDNFSYAKHLPRLPLRALEVGMDDFTAKDDEPPFALDTVSTFGINVATFVHLDQCPDWYCPNLKNLLLRQIVDREILLLIPFLNRHSDQITYLEIRVDHATLLSDVGKILEQTPRLRHLFFGYLNFDAMDCPPLPSLTTITLESIFTSPTPGDQRMAVSCILPLIASEKTPQLEFVTMLEDWEKQRSLIKENDDADSGFRALDTFHEACRARQLPVLDRNGRDFSER